MGTVSGNVQRQFYGFRGCAYQAVRFCIVILPNVFLICGYARGVYDQSEASDQKDGGGCIRNMYQKLTDKNSLFIMGVNV